MKADLINQRPADDVADVVVGEWRAAIPAKEVTIADSYSFDQVKGSLDQVNVNFDQEKGVLIM